jgi:hypothetical protein
MRRSAYFICGLHARGPEIDLGRDAGVAQFAGDGEVVGHVGLVEGDDHHRPARDAAGLAARRPQRRRQARDAEREAGGRGHLAGEPRHQVVVAPAAADRAEAHRLALVVEVVEQQLGLEHRAGVVLQAADDDGSNRRLVVATPRPVRAASILASSSSPSSPSAEPPMTLARLASVSERSPPRRPVKSITESAPCRPGPRPW